MTTLVSTAYRMLSESELAAHRFNRLHPAQVVVQYDGGYDVAADKAAIEDTKERRAKAARGVRKASWRRAWLMTLPIKEQLYLTKPHHSEPVKETPDTAVRLSWLYTHDNSRIMDGELWGSRAGNGWSYPTKIVDPANSKLSPSGKSTILAWKQIAPAIPKQPVVIDSVSDRLPPATIIGKDKFRGGTRKYSLKDDQYHKKAIDWYWMQCQHAFGDANAGMFEHVQVMSPSDRFIFEECYYSSGRVMRPGQNIPDIPWKDRLEVVTSHLNVDYTDAFLVRKQLKTIFPEDCRERQTVYRNLKDTVNSIKWRHLREWSEYLADPHAEEYNRHIPAERTLLPPVDRCHGTTPWQPNVKAIHYGLPGQMYNPWRMSWVRTLPESEQAWVLFTLKGDMTPKPDSIKADTQLENQDDYDSEFIWEFEADAEPVAGTDEFGDLESRDGWTPIVYRSSVPIPVPEYRDDPFTFSPPKEYAYSIMGYRDSDDISKLDDPNWRPDHADPVVDAIRKIVSKMDLQTINKLRRDAHPANGAFDISKLSFEQSRAFWAATKARQKGLMKVKDAEATKVWQSRSPKEDALIKKLGASKSLKQAKFFWMSLKSAPSKYGRPEFVKLVAMRYLTEKVFPHFQKVNN